MKILLDICHPGHVHLLKNFYFEIKKRGHFLIVTTKDIPVVKDLLFRYKIDFTNFGKKSDSIFGKAIAQLKYNYKLYCLVKKNNINIGIGSSITIAHISRLTKMKSIIIDDDDDEVQPLFVKYAHPFCDTILSPISLKGHRRSQKSVFYSGYHELAYLHPNRFQPDPNILDSLGIKTDEKYFILRFNSFNAHHDIGVKGISLENKRRLINILKPYGRIFITTERDIEQEFEQYKITIEPHKIHSLIYYSTLLIGDSQTMTSEAAVLGVPSIRSNSLVGKIAYLEEQEHRYGLTYGFKPDDSDRMFAKIEELLQNPNLKPEWQNRRNKMLEDKIDVTSFYIWFIENYPDSRRIMMGNKKYQYNFK